MTNETTETSAAARFADITQAISNGVVITRVPEGRVLEPENRFGVYDFLSPADKPTGGESPDFTRTSNSPTFTKVRVFSPAEAQKKKESGQPMPASDPPTRDEMQAELRAVSAQNTAQFDRVMAKLDVVTGHVDASITRLDAAVARMDTLEKTMVTKSAMIWTVVTGSAVSIAAIVGIMMQFLSYGGDMQTSGSQLAADIAKPAFEAAAQANENRQQIEVLSKDIRALIQSMEAGRTPAAPEPAGQ